MFNEREYHLFTADLAAMAANATRFRNCGGLVGTVGPVVCDRFAPVELVEDFNSSFAARMPMPLCYRHAGIVGAVTSIGLRGSRLLMAAVLWSDDLIERADAGDRFQLSRGGSTRKIDVLARGEISVANGRTWPGPVVIAHNTICFEISITEPGEAAEPASWLTVESTACSRPDLSRVDLACSFVARSDAKPQPISMPAVDPASLEAADDFNCDVLSAREVGEPRIRPDRPWEVSRHSIRIQRAPVNRSAVFPGHVFTTFR